MAGLPKRFVKQVLRIAENNGCVVEQAARSGIRITNGPGNVLILHRTPGRPEVYRRSLRDDFRRKLGIDVPREAWPR